jgi:hypothetical protein
MVQEAYRGRAPIDAQIRVRFREEAGKTFAHFVTYRFWHEAPVRCDAPSRSLSDVKRTWRPHRERVDATRLTDAVEKVSKTKLWN